MSHSEDMVPSINLFQAVSSVAFVAAVGYLDLDQIVSIHYECMTTLILIFSSESNKFLLLIFNSMEYFYSSHTNLYFILFWLSNVY